jgi:3-deoxy-D-manno-octulosonic-acid transferase
MVLYSFALTVGLVLSSPWWVMRMMTTQRYREGLRERLGRVPAALRVFVAGKKVAWVHAVSVGEVLAATRLVAELEAALQTHVSEARHGAPEWVVVVSTTTRTGQALARERFGARRVFYCPLDFAFAVRSFLRVLRPAVLVLMESEVWPRMLHEARRMSVPVAVVNARVSDRSFARGMRAKALWGRVLRDVSLWLSQSEEDARRLVAMGASAENVRAIGNLKYDVRAPKVSRVAELIQEAAAGRAIVVAGSTVDRINDKSLSEEEMVVQAWEGRIHRGLNAMLVLAPRHPERFAETEAVAMEFHYAKASEWGLGTEKQIPCGNDNKKNYEVIVLDTIGDLAAVYGVADVAFVGGSLVTRGGHNPLEPAQFGVPVVMGPSYENFRDVVAKMQAVEAIAILGQDAGGSPLRRKERASGRDGRNLVAELEQTLMRLLTDREAAKAMGERGRRVFEEQQGATGRAVAALVAMLEGATPGAKAPDASRPMRPEPKGSGYLEAEARTTPETTATATADAGPYGMTKNDMTPKGNGMTPKDGGSL